MRLYILYLLSLSFLTLLIAPSSGAESHHILRWVS